MNIKEAIEKGLYPVDDKGRALVPMRNGSIAVIYATDSPHIYADQAQPIAGYAAHDAATWSPDGRFADPPSCSLDLLPPPPRKVPVKARIECALDGYKIRHLARVDGGNFPDAVTIELTGEYEEPWA